MTKQNSVPGVSRDARLSDQGLQRLELLLSRGGQVSAVVLAQWVKRYGDAAREIIKAHGQYTVDLDEDT